MTPESSVEVCNLKLTLNNKDLKHVQNQQQREERVAVDVETIRPLHRFLNRVR